MKAPGKSPWRSMNRRKISPANLLKVRRSGEISSVSSVSVYGLMRNLRTTLVQTNSVRECKGARSSIEKLFYFTRISEDKCNESLEATLTHTHTHTQHYTLCDCWIPLVGSNAWLCVDENTLQLKKTFEVGAESAILVLVLSVWLFSLNCGLSNKIIVIVRRC